MATIGYPCVYHEPDGTDEGADRAAIVIAKDRLLVFRPDGSHFIVDNANEGDMPGEFTEI
jgi:hypothetical protein